MLPCRLVVERTFYWLGQNRPTRRDYERLCAGAEAFVYAAMIRSMVRRLARTYRTFKTVSLGISTNSGNPPRDPTPYPKGADWPFRLPRNPDMF